MATEYALRAAEAVENIRTKTSAEMNVGIAKAVTYALLDVAAAIREHGK